ncbi:MAG: preprotein translocase subunit SecG [Cellvibrionaceae bacterium]|nr:preprotein translocase subunit SecG [Cellvibrionaceae bacterium]
MENIVLAVHLLTALAIIGLIMIQQGKGAEMGASFGSGASQTLFGSAGSGNFFSRMTGIFAAVFFATSFGLAYMAKQQTELDGNVLPTLDIDIPAQISEIPSLNAGAESEVPTLDDAESAAESDVPAIDDEAGSEIPAVEEDIPEAPVE